MAGYMIEQVKIVQHMDVKTIQISQHWDIGQLLLVLRVLVDQIGVLLMKVILAIILLTTQLIMVYAQ